MRVNPNLTPHLLSSLQRVTADENSALLQLASGKRVQNPSDDPAGMATVVQLQSMDANNKQYLRNVSAVRSNMQYADSMLSSSVTDMERAVSLGVRGATGTMNPADREAIAQEIDG